MESFFKVLKQQIIATTCIIVFLGFMSVGVLAYRSVTSEPEPESVSFASADSTTDATMAAMPTADTVEIEMDDFQHRLKNDYWAEHGQKSNVLLTMQYIKLVPDWETYHGTIPFEENYGYSLYRDGVVARWEWPTEKIEQIGNMSPDTVTEIAALVDSLPATQQFSHQLNFVTSPESVQVNVYNKNQELIAIQTSEGRGNRPALEPIYQECVQMLTDLNQPKAIKELVAPTAENTRLTRQANKSATASASLASTPPSRPTTTANFYDKVENNSWAGDGHSSSALITIDYDLLTPDWQAHQGVIPRLENYGYTIYRDGSIAKWNLDTEEIKLIGNASPDDMQWLRDLIDPLPFTQTMNKARAFVESPDSVQVNVYNAKGELIVLQVHTARDYRPELEPIYRFCEQMLLDLNQPQVVRDLVAPLEYNIRVKK